MLMSQGAVRSAVALDELPGDLRDTLRDEFGVADEDDPVVTFLGASNVLVAGPADAAGAARGGPPLAPTAVLARPGDREAAPTVDGGSDGVADLGALPDGTAEIARVGDVTIVTEGAHVELVGFHEASSPDALALEPIGPLATVSADGSEEGGPVIALPTRHRGTDPTSAVDIAVRPGAEVVAPLSGEVIDVSEFALYGRTTDVTVRIRPDDDPDLIVSVVHVVDPLVAAGDRIEAGSTPLAAEARQLPFDSQIDRFTTAHRGQPAPHVHIEAHRA